MVRIMEQSSRSVWLKIFRRPTVRWDRGRGVVWRVRHWQTSASRICRWRATSGTRRRRCRGRRCCTPFGRETGSGGTALSACARLPDPRPR